jgi:GNAT superfamily N-acetyltransferase
VRCVARRAEVADVDTACAVLADAFADSPWTRWTVDGDDHVRRIEGLQRLMIEHVALPYGEVWVAGDEHDDVLSVAVWSLPSSVVPKSVFESIDAEQVRLEGARHDASQAAEALVARLRPTAAHYYLGAVGTRRDRHRQGLASAVLAPMLDRAERDGTDVYLETSEPANVEFYGRLGFTTMAELAIPDGGPPVWTLLRSGSVKRA